MANHWGELTITLYDELPAASQALFSDYGFYNTRNRITGVLYQKIYNTNLSLYNSAIAYDYDVHGNVKELLNATVDNDLLTFGMGAGQQVIKRLQYEYDLVSGNVHQVTYQAGEPDQFMHRYQYDSDNRITEVETSKDGKIWENDASYFYYNHGPLARTEIGDKKVQGIDYAYTIQGWIKGVNSEELAPEFDMGHDGGTATSLPTHINSQVAQDAFGYSLSYFAGDYQSRIAGKDNFLTYSKHNNYNSTAKNLYNGNIREMFTAIMKDDETPLGTYSYQYQYDQLNRIKSMNSRRLAFFFGMIFNGLSKYQTSYDYDRNGNITFLKRWADDGSSLFPLPMDDFTYDYIAGTNKLALVHDAVSAGNFDDDLDDQVAGLSALSFPTYSLGDETTHNYRYDAIGQLVQDKTEEIDTIIWTVTGKVKKIQRFAFSEKPDLEFEYNPMGQRIMKIEYPKSAPGVINTAGIKKTYYVHDAQGNVMSIYTLKTEDSEKNLYLSERMLYGSSRLGMEQINEIVASTNSGNIDINTAQQRVVGDKRFELSNHLGNVLAVVTDRKLPEYNSTESLAYYLPDVVSYSDYYPFGMQIPGRNGSTREYRYGFNGQEKDDEVFGSEGTSYTAEYWQYDSRLGRRWNRDPKPNLSISEYACFANNPIWFSDPFGDTIKVNSYTESDAGFQKWKESDAGKKFFKDYGIGGVYENITVEIERTSSIYTSPTGRRLAVDGLTETFVEEDGVRKRVLSDKNYNDFKEANKDLSKYASDQISKNQNLIFKIQYTNSSDDVETGSTILHETQHVRINTYYYKMYRKPLLKNSSTHHVYMLNNYKRGGQFTEINKPRWYLPQGNGIYDFNSERWNYYNQYRSKGEHDLDIDRKTYDSGESDLFQLD